MARSIDDYPVTPFVKRVTYFSGGTAFLDGFNMIVASVALTLMGDMFTPTEMGLYASLYLIGCFLAAIVGGKVGDKFGRTLIFKTAPLVIAVVSIAMLFFHAPWAVIVGRFLMGICIGADYPMASTMASEYSSAEWRGKALVILMMAWYVGALAGSLVGFLLYNVGDNWPWLLFTTAVPAVIIFLGRYSIPEPARWLVTQGRLTEADEALKKVYGAEASVDDLGDVRVAEEGEPAKKSSLFAAFKRGYFKRFFFVVGFWACQSIPVTVIFMFGPTIMQTFGLGEGALSVLGTALIYVFFMIGVAPAIKTINGMKRRKTLIGTYVVMTATLLLLGFFADAGAIVILVIFLVYAVAYGLQSVLDNVYPPELFPTEIRATAIGSSNAMTKVINAVAAQLFPIGLAAFGLGPVVLIGGVVSAIGLLISVLLAPETQGKTLEESSAL